MAHPHELFNFAHRHASLKFERFEPRRLKEVLCTDDRNTC
ncbi:unnamed protein product [Fusarium graminearum]|uniref:Chromosome 2, complete genome n=1 Tax=Gibberella zeae (strain ATCC MYA-4620 / CBS 123657 / FGSC 9075 / NRRL 31084 / PH-1) TaxID=229533 RepID=A0A1C3YN18_GIBZE|nr:unnamed protein product [Fusarium graminearum]